MKHFTLLPFNEDSLVLEWPGGTHLGTLEEMHGSDPWVDGPPTQLLTALGWAYIPLSEYQATLIGAAMRCRRDEDDAQKSEGRTPADWLARVIDQTQLLSGRFSTPPKMEAGCFYDGAVGQTHNDLRLCHLAFEYGWLCPLGETELREDNAADFADDALTYLNDHVMPDPYFLDWVDGDLMCQVKEWSLS